MSNRELNRAQLALLEKKMEAEDSVLVIAICVNPEKDKFTQLVGYGVQMELIPIAFADAWKNLQTEIRNKKS